MLYSYVENNIAGESRELPQNFANVSGFCFLDDKALASHNWFPVEDQLPTVKANEVAVESGRTLDPKRSVVIVTYEVRKLDVPDLDAQKASKILQINQAYAQAMAPLAKEYPEEERWSWGKQEQEANNYMAWVALGRKGDAPATPVLDLLLEGRNADGGEETVEELSGRIQNNVQMMIQTQRYTGHRQRLEKQVKAATSVADLKAIDPLAAFGLSVVSTS